MWGAWLRQAHRDGRKGRIHLVTNRTGVVLETAQFNEPFFDPTGEQGEEESVFLQ